ncbi:MAG TPA: c-type cytochrome [Vicinamibacteria bacterium]|nr:c-type cytochrome [Vicinamibacteria bacterium]
MRTSLLVGLVSLLVTSHGTSRLFAQENPFTTTVDERMGARVFASECGRCHGLDGKGNDETGAPDLTTGTFSNASTEAGLFSVIRDGIPGTTMVGIGWAPAETIWQVVTYVNSLNPNPADFDLPGDARRGEAVFAGKGNCRSCHMVRGAGGRLGPDLSTVGNRRDPDELRKDLTDPDETVEPRWWTMKVVRADGSRVEGLRMDEDTFTLRIMDGNENLWHFSKSGVLSIERSEKSTMPSATETLNESEIDDLIAYLFSLRKES